MLTQPSRTVLLSERRRDAGAKRKQIFRRRGGGESSLLVLGAVTLISQDPQSRAAGPSPLSRALHFHDDTSPLTPSSRGRDPVPPRTQTGPIRALGRPDKNTQRPAAPMTVCDIRSDSFSITTSAVAWCEESAFVSAKTPPPHSHTSVREEVRFREGGRRRRGEKDLIPNGGSERFFSSSTGSARAWDTQVGVTPLVQHVI